MIAGGCHCTHIRYEIALEQLTDIAHCHCSICRKTSGGIVTTWVTIPLNTLQWVTTEPTIYESSSHAKRYFCSRCGALLALFTTKAPETIDITIATLDQPELYPPNRHIWVEDKLPWIHLDEHLPTEGQELL